MTAPLANVAVLVTRPALQAQPLARKIVDLGGEALLFPAVEIEALALAPAEGALGHIREFDLVVFVSPTAARLAMPAITGAGGLAPGTRTAAVGPGTAAELKNAGVRDIITPETGFDSEALFDALCSRPPAPRRVLIVRGQGGREWLGDALRRRGVEVAHLECYRRVVPAGNLDELLPRWRRGDRLAVTATSAEIVANLFSMAGAGGRSWLCRAPFFAVHPRVAAAAFACGVQTLFITGAGDDALALGLQTWFGRPRSARAAA